MLQSRLEVGFAHTLWRRMGSGLVSWGTPRPAPTLRRASHFHFTLETHQPCGQSQMETELLLEKGEWR